MYCFIAFLMGFEVKNNYSYCMVIWLIAIIK